MKTKNILMSVLLAMGFIAAKAAGYPPELALVSQPVLVYNYNSITVYYDVQTSEPCPRLYDYALLRSGRRTLQLHHLRIL